MKLHRVFLNNFGLFAGENILTFDTDDTEGNISLIAGMNGAGKTTFLEAVQLALYGKLSLGKRVAQSEYLAHLRSRVHRDRSGHCGETGAAVGLDFDHETMGTASRYQLTRRWTLHGDSVAETFDVEKDGEPLAEVDQQFWEDFVRELVPPGVSQLFFFDGEKIQRLADDEDSQSVAEAIKSLLGLDLVERLQDDLSIYRDRQLKKSGSRKTLAELEAAREKVESIKARASELNYRRADLKSVLDGVSGEVAQAEKSLTLQGGRFVENREQLKVDHAVSAEKVEASEQAIRELTETALPFAFCGSLCVRLAMQLEKEQESKRSEAVREWAVQKLSAVKGLGASRNVAPDFLEAIEHELLGDIPTCQPPIHDLSSDSERRFRSWFDEASGPLAERLRQATSDLEGSTRGLQQAQKKLRQVPEADALKGRMTNLNDALARRATTEAELKKLDDELKGVRLELEAAKREVKRAQDRIELDTEQVSRFKLLEKCQSALVSYQMRLTVAKVDRLGEEVTACFHHLHRKGDLVHQIKVDPSSCKVELFDSEGRKLDKRELSAGEKQMYAVAMLWGLARTSGRKLPLIIDTPLGRLDSAHRDNLVERYFPHAADQVIILSTDTEIDQSYYESLRPHVARAYRLEFNHDLARTEIEKGYFWKEAEICRA